MQELSGASVSLPVYAGAGQPSPGLTLGKAGPLQERVSAPVAEEVKAWAQQLPEAQQRLIYPERRTLKGEDAANLAGQQAAPTSGEAGSRQQAYQPPKDRGSPGTGQGEKGKGEAGRAGPGVAGAGGGPDSGLPPGGWGAGRASRLGLLIPTVILGLYVGYVIFHWREIRGEV